ncbi:MAG: MFS transporter, partial [Alphaproteobacteria bacterium]
MTIETGTAVGERAHDRDFFGHPKGLRILFMTAMWERFSYYGMRALLIFYLTQHLLFGDDRALLIFGAYTSMVYLSPVIGGLLADRYLGS